MARSTTRMAGGTSVGQPPKRRRAACLREGEREAETKPGTPSAVSSSSALTEAVECASSLVGLVATLADADEGLDAGAAAAVLRRLPGLLAATAVPASVSQAAFSTRLEAGEAFEVAAVPSRWPEERGARNALWQCPGSTTLGGPEVCAEVAGAAAFLRAQDRVEEVLDDNAQRANAPLSWLADVACFYGALRPGPPLPRHVLEDCADEVLRRLSSAGGHVDTAGVAQACRVARGVSNSGALMRHGIFAAVAARVVEELPAVPWSARHDAALALALVRPWDGSTARSADALLRALAAPGSLHEAASKFDAEGPAQEGGSDVAEGKHGPTVAGTSVGGERFGEKKENQDRFHTALSGQVACLVVVDGHGKKGAAVASEVCASLKQALAQVQSGPGVAQVLADALLAADAAVLLNPQVEVELSGAACAVVHVADGRLTAAHLGDCRVILGRREGGEPGGEPLRWRALRLTEDHRPGDLSEALRLVASGARVRRAGPAGAPAVPGSLGPPRLWHRMNGVAPGLALSRGLGDALGQGCGLVPETDAVEAALEVGDSVVVVASDGVFDVLSDAEVLHCCRVFWPSRGAAEAAAAVVAAAGRAWAARGGYRDDATCVVLFL